MKALVAGWFSFEKMGATAGDLLVKDLACEWLEEAGFDCDVALAAPFRGGVDWKRVRPNRYSHVVFVCGPFGNGWPIPQFLDRFKGRHLTGLNLTMIEPLDVWNPFDLVWERDSSTMSRPDVSFLSKRPLVPVVGIVRVHPQKEYRGMGRHKAAHDAIARLVDSSEMAAVRIDTRLDLNATGLRTPAEVESLIARMDVVVTTRLHGLVLALKHGVPAVAIDPIPRGAKILRQAEVIGWPFVFTADKLDEATIRKAFEYCLTDAAREKAQWCRARARRMVQQVRRQFVKSLSRTGPNGGR